MPKAEELQARYDALCARHEPTIAKLSARGDKQAAEMRRLFDAASAAWNDDDGAHAKELSEQARAEQARCEKANEKANALRDELATALRKLERARSKFGSASDKQVGPGARDHLRRSGVALVGFADEQRWRNVLNALPPVALSHIRQIEYIDEARSDGAEGEVVKRRVPGQSVEIKVFRQPIEFDAVTVRRKQAWTLCHEYAHVLFDRCISKQAKSAWRELYNQHLAGKHDRAWIGRRAQVDSSEDFCECFAAYWIKPNEFAATDAKRYDLIKKIVEAL